MWPNFGICIKFRPYKENLSESFYEYEYEMNMKYESSLQRYKLPEYENRLKSFSLYYV